MDSWKGPKMCCCNAVVLDGQLRRSCDDDGCSNANEGIMVSDCDSDSTSFLSFFHRLWMGWAPTVLFPPVGRQSPATRRRE
jgi:hypothetical protein